ncbi:Zona pellucida-like domain containing protein [Aphelenchoides avenae]|nr:Zona pellucida-like domain containing protein [Aphelenchus avenae]
MTFTSRRSKPTQEKGHRDHGNKDKRHPEKVDKYKDVYGASCKRVPRTQPPKPISHVPPPSKPKTRSASGEQSVKKKGNEINVEPTQMSEVEQSARAAKPKSEKLLPRQLISVQRTEPGDDVVRTELRYVSYRKKGDLPEGPVEEYAVGDALSALIARMEELKLQAPEHPNAVYETNQYLKREVESLQERLREAEEECQQLKQRLRVTEEVAMEYSRSGVETEPTWATIAKLEKQRRQASSMEPELEQAKRQLADVAERLQKYRSEGRLHQQEVKERLARRLSEIRTMTLEADRQKRKRGPVASVGRHQRI